MVAATASWPSRHTVARTGTTSPTTALAGYLPPETTGATSSIPIRPTTTHPVRLARRGAAWCCTADRRAAPCCPVSFTASSRPIHTVVSTPFPRARRRHCADRAVVARRQGSGQPPRHLRRDSLWDRRVAVLDGDASALVVLGPVGLRRNRAVRQRGCRECGQRAVQAALVGANEVRYRRGRASSGRPLRRRAAGYNRPTRPRTSNCSVRG